MSVPVAFASASVELNEVVMHLMDALNPDLANEMRVVWRCTW